MEYKNQKGIISIIAVLSIGMFALGTALIMAKGVLQQSATNHNNTSTYQAFYTAESRGNECVYQLKNSLPCVLGAHSDINGATSDIPVAPSFQSGYAVIIATADRSDTHRNIVTTIRNFPEDDAFMFEYGLYTPQMIDLGGNASISGNIFATQKAFCGEGGKEECDCPDGECQGSVTIDGEIIKETEAVIPEIKNPESYHQTEKNICDAQTYLEGKTVDDIVYITEGACGKGKDKKTPQKVFNNLDLTGALWIEGDIKLTGGKITARITEEEKYLALIVTGNLELAGNIEITGIVYVFGETTIGTGGARINGSLISLGGTGISANGTLKIDYEPSILDYWQDLFIPVSDDEDNLYNYEPQFDHWNEE